MKTKNFSKLALGCLLALTQATGVFCQNNKISLDGEWLVKDFKIGMGMYYPEKWIQLVYFPDTARLTEEAIKVNVPTSVQKAYKDLNKLPDPYYGFNAKQYRWMEDREWWFVRSVNIPKDWENKNLRIKCGMINYRSDVWVNDTWCGVTYGNYTELNHNITKAVKPGESNLVIIRLRAPENSSEEIPDPVFVLGDGFHKRRHVTPTNPQVSEFLMSSCLFGWDWGPHLVPIGILQPIFITANDFLEIEDPFIYTKELMDNNTKAILKFSTSLKNNTGESAVSKLALSISSKENPGEIVFTKTFDVSINENSNYQLTDSFTIENPDLWWPNNMGEQSFYQLKLQLLDENNKQLDLEQTNFGIREVKKIFNEDPNWMDGVHLDYGEEEYPWTFVVNGKKVFAQGMNWIPVDALLDLKPERYRYLIKTAQLSHVNMFRVWGEGLYETETFYNLCDSMGIMVWQDFWVGGYSDAQPQESSEFAIVENIKRTRNHPSLVLYCGGNEFDASIPARLGQLTRLGELCKEYDPSRFFHWASPFGGDRHGGMGIVNEEQRNVQNRRFISEGGYQQSWPPKSDMLKFIPKGKMFPIIENIDMLSFHNSYLGMDYRFTRNIDVFGFARSVDEVIGIEMHRNIIGWQSQLEHTRLEKFKVSGCLFWAHNDVWPTTSWSMVNYYGTCKNHYYVFKRSAAPTQITASQQHEILKPGEPYDLKVIAIHDAEIGYQNAKATVQIFMGQKAEKVYEKEFNGDILPVQNKFFGKMDWTIPTDPKERNFLVRCELVDEKGKLIARNEYTCHIGNENRKSITGGFWGEYRTWDDNDINMEMKGFPTKIEPSQSKSFDIHFHNTSSNIAMGVEYLITNLPEGLRLYLDDNYLNLLPNERRTIQASIENHLDDKSIKELDLNVLTNGWNVKESNRNITVKLKE